MTAQAVQDLTDYISEGAPKSKEPGRACNMRELGRTCNVRGGAAVGGLYDRKLDDMEGSMQDDIRG